MSALKYTLSLIFICFAFYILATPVLAAESEEELKAGNYKAFQHADFTSQGQIHFLYCALTGEDKFYDEKCIGSVETPGQQGKALRLFARLPDGGALGGISNTMVAMYTSPPTSSGLYLANLGSQFGLSKPAYAQVTGSGNSVLQPVYKMWLMARNLAYLLFVVIFLVVGFMVMFRTKLNPQTVISAQQALPGLVLGLILVTFSYFIASLIVDFSFVGMRLVYSLFIQSDMLGSAGKNIGPDTSIYGAYAGYIFNGAIVTKLITPLLSLVGIAPIEWEFSWKIIPNLLLGVGGLATIVGGAIIGLIVIIGLIIQMLRVLLELIKAYVTILVMTIIGPFYILFSAIPGRGKAVGSWIKTLLANVLIFPAIYGAFLFAGIFLLNTDTQIGGSMPLFGGIPTQWIAGLIGYGILFAMPSIPEMVKGAVISGKVDPGALAKTGMAGMMGGVGIIGGGGKLAWGHAVGPTLAARQAYQKTVAQERAEGKTTPTINPAGAPGTPRSRWQRAQDWIIRH